MCAHIFNAILHLKNKKKKSIPGSLMLNIHMQMGKEENPKNKYSKKEKLFLSRAILAVNSLLPSTRI